MIFVVNYLKIKIETLTPMSKEPRQSHRNPPTLSKRVFDVSLMWIFIPSPVCSIFLATFAVSDITQQFGILDPATTPRAGPLKLYSISFFNQQKLNLPVKSHSDVEFCVRSVGNLENNKSSQKIKCHTSNFRNVFVTQIINQL